MQKRSLSHQLVAYDFTKWHIKKCKNKKNGDNTFAA